MFFVRAVSAFLGGQRPRIFFRYAVTISGASLDAITITVIRRRSTLDDPETHTSASSRNLRNFRKCISGLAEIFGIWVYVIASGSPELPESGGHLRADYQPRICSARRLASKAGLRIFRKLRTESPPISGNCGN